MSVVDHGQGEAKHGSERSDTVSDDRRPAVHVAPIEAVTELHPAVSGSAVS